VKRPAGVEGTPEAGAADKKAKAGSAEKGKKGEEGSAEKKAKGGHRRGSAEKKAKVKRSFPNGLEIEELALGQPAGKVAKAGKTVSACSLPPYPSPQCMCLYLCGTMHMKTLYSLALYSRPPPHLSDVSAPLPLVSPPPGSCL